MRCGLAILCFLCSSAVADQRDAARASHRQERISWSNKTGLPLKTVDHLWNATIGSGADDLFDNGIETVDAASLRNRKQVLFVTTGGNGHCLDLYVFGNSGNDENFLWTLSELPNDGGGICHEQMLPYPTASATLTGDIVVQVPTAAAWVKREGVGNYQVSTALMVYTYRWNGATYKLARARRIATYESETFNSQVCTFGKPCQ
jgi:hypothetical protein